MGTRSPALVPARMLNEFTYCPRLFYLEWVQGEFEHSADTLDGVLVHRAADTGGGRVPTADDPGALEDDAPLHARSLLLSSERHGLSARIDVVEGRGRTVTPVDYKRGSPPDVPEGAWEPERVQLCAYALILRDNGYQCSEGFLYFAQARRRVRIVIDEPLVERTLALLAQLRETAERGRIPPPLVDSPKCPRCSLVGICLPDEVNALSRRRGRRPLRRLIPFSDEAAPLYVTTPGARVGVRGGRIEVTANGEKLASTRLIDVSQVCVFGNVQVSTQALRELFDREIRVLYFTWGGWLAGVAQGLPHQNIELRIAQHAAASDPGRSHEIARALVVGKIKNQRTLLRRNARTDVSTVLRELDRLARRAHHAASSDELLGLEGAAAKAYFACFPTMLREDRSLPGALFSFAGRNRRPPRDAVNALLSFVYALLVKDAVAAALAVGFDPFLGFYHRPRYGRPALALDIAEEFRPIVADSVVVGVVNNGEVAESSFLVRGGRVGLTPTGRRAVIAAYERRLATAIRHPLFGYSISYRRVLEVQFRLLARFLAGEIPDYVPFRTR